MFARLLRRFGKAFISIKPNEEKDLLTYCLSRLVACRAATKDKEKEILIIDVQKVIADAVWDQFRVSQPRLTRWFLSRHDYNVEVPMNFFKFENVPKQPQDIWTPQSAKKIQGNPKHVIMETDFRNHTEETQTHNFRFEKMRKSVFSITYHKGFCFENKTNFSLDVPKFLVPGGKVTNETIMKVTVRETQRQEVEDSMVTAATSAITVAPKRRCTASSIMEEVHIDADFKVEVRMSMPAGKAKAVIKDKNGDTVFHYTVENLAELFPKENRIDGPDKFTVVKFDVEGVVSGVHMSSQNIKLDSRELQDDQPSEKPQADVLPV